MVRARWLGIMGVLLLACSGKVTGESTGTPGMGGTAGTAGAGAPTAGQGTPVCSSGDRLACVGPDGCAGFQLCPDDGMDWSSCQCTDTLEPPLPDDPIVPGDACVAISYESESIPFDVLFLLDRSSAMQTLSETGVSWDQAVRTGISDFVQHRASTGTAVGLQYFPLGGQAPLSCEADYATPAVELAPLPQNAPALVQSLEMGETAGSSSTGPALQGAIDYMKRAAGDRPYAEHAVVVVTAGLPAECEPADVSGLASIASAALVESPYVRTFVIALGSGREALQALASAGGTEQAHLIAGGDVAEQVRTILFQSFAHGPPCAFQLPPPPAGESLDVDRIYVQYWATDSSEWLTVPRLASPEDCELYGSDGWFYDESVAPTIEFCAGTCAKMPGSDVQILFDCTPGPRP